MHTDDSGRSRWHLVVEIAAKLWVEGHYVTTVDRLLTQRFADLQWSSHHAARVLGGHAHVQVAPRGNHTG